MSRCWFNFHNFLTLLGCGNENSAIRLYRITNDFLPPRNWTEVIHLPCFRSSRIEWGIKFMIWYFRFFRSNLFSKLFETTNKCYWWSHGWLNVQLKDTESTGPALKSDTFYSREMHSTIRNETRKYICRSSFMNGTRSNILWLKFDLKLIEWTILGLTFTTDTLSP